MQPFTEVILQCTWLDPKTYDAHYMELGQLFKESCEQFAEDHFGRLTYGEYDSRKNEIDRFVKDNAKVVAKQLEVKWQDKCKVTAPSTINASSIMQFSTRKEMYLIAAMK